jgi:hypothetical protein
MLLVVLSNSTVCTEHGISVVPFEQYKARSTLYSRILLQFGVDEIKNDVYENTKQDDNADH